MLFMQATTAENAVMKSSPVAVSTSVMPTDRHAVDEHERRAPRRSRCAAIGSPAELERHLGARMEDARELAHDCLNSTSARIILMPPPVDPDDVAKLQRYSIHSGAKIGHTS